MPTLFSNILNLRLWSLFVKEFHQIRRNTRLLVLLIIPPTLNIILFGIALNPTFENLRLGVVDYSRTAESRELISAFNEALVFKSSGYYASTNDLGEAIDRSDLDAGLVVPVDFSEKRLRGETVEVQLLVDAVDANTATIAGGYAGRIIADLNKRIVAMQTKRQATTDDSPAVTAAVSAAKISKRASVTPRLTLLYNPGLKSSWFITSGMIGLLLVLQGSVVSAAALVREKEIGTVEQLLMTPANSTEIIVAKVGPIFLLLALDIGLSLGVARVIFGLPVRGSLILFFLAASLCVLCGIGLGMLIATFTRTQQQAQLMSFFTNPPLALLSGATTPIEAMPAWLQPVTSLNPVKHFAIISRGILLKGSGIDVLYPQALALVVIALVMISVSSWQFRKQLG